MSTIITIQATDKVGDSRADLNTNFSNLNTDKAETLDDVLDTSGHTDGVKYAIKYTAGVPGIDTIGGGGSVAAEDVTVDDTNFVNLVGTDAQTLFDDIDDLFSGVVTDLADLSITAAASEINILDGATLSTAELNILDGVTASTAELNHTDGVTSNIQTQLDAKVDENAPITGATKTKITYDAKGLVTAGADATTADIAASTNKNYVTDAQQTIIAATTASFTTSQATKLGHITVTQAVDLDAIETRVNALDAAVVLKGTWDASGGSFPGSGTAQAGESWIVSVGGTVDSVAFVANDRLLALTDNASTSTYAANWHKLDYTDQVLSVNGQTGAVTLDADDIDDTSTTNKFTTSSDISKLAGIEAGADVTDATNVAGAGALMDSEVTSLSGIKSLTVPDNTTISTFTKGLLDNTSAGAWQTDLALVPGTNIQPLDSTLTNFAALTGAANKLAVFTGSDTFSTIDFSSFSQGLMDNTSAAGWQTDLGLVPGTDVQAYDAELAAIAGVTSAADKVPYFTGLGTAAVADLPSFGRTLIANTSAADARSDLVAATTSQTECGLAGMIRTVADETIKLFVKMPHAGTITETTTISVSGTCTATFKVNTTALGGTANSVSSVEQSQSHASTNTFSAGDDIQITISSNSSCVDLSFMIKYTRTLS